MTTAVLIVHKVYTMHSYYCCTAATPPPPHLSHRPQVVSLSHLAASLEVRGAVNVPLAKINAIEMRQLIAEVGARYFHRIRVGISTAPAAAAGTVRLSPVTLTYARGVVLPSAAVRISTSSEIEKVCSCCCCCCWLQLLLLLLLLLLVVLLELLLLSASMLLLQRQRRQL